MAILNSTDTIGSYRVQSLIKSNLYTETYRVEGTDGTPYFLKLFVLKRTPRQLLNNEATSVREIEYCRKLKHRNLTSFIDEGTLQTEESECRYYVTTYLDGVVLADLLQREGRLAEADALRIFRSILEGLKYLHSQVPVLCHNDLDPSNVLLSDVAGGEAEIIDMGHLSERCCGSVWFDTSDIAPLFHANETRVGIFDEQSDIFSACAVLYAMLAGRAPWVMALPEEGDYKARFADLINYRKKTPLDLSSIEVSPNTARVLKAGLELKSADRVASVSQLLQILDGEAPAEESESKGDSSARAFDSHQQRAQSPNYVEFPIKKGSGNGFEDIAGMAELKETLQKQVIFVIKNDEIAKEYKITPPNGILLYGPPGCGKSFFAEKFAEETGFSYLFVKSSDLASSYVHGSQEKINQLFEQAAKHAPIVVCFDEFDALVPDRSWNNVSAEEVNEFLTQMNNCARRGIFIVATSNRPDKIDPAVLRTGRIDKMVYVPLPDREARRELFSLYLKGRPVEEGIDVDALADMTDGYIASDIAYIVNDSAMVAAYTRAKITQDLLNTSVGNTRPSVRADSLKQYDEIKQKMEDTNRRNINAGRAVVNPW